MYAYRPFLAVGRRNKSQATALVIRLETLLLVAWFDSRLGRHDPDLQEVDQIGVRRIELTVSDTTARTHALNIAIRNDRTGAHAVLMLELSIKHIRSEEHTSALKSREKLAYRLQLV